MKVLKTHKCFEGLTQFWEHESAVTRTPMKFSTFIPKGEVRGCLIWLSGLTCNEENFITKAGAQRELARHQLMVICPDTSPRGLNLPGEHEAYDFGSGAGFYVDALTEGYRDHYRMYSYITLEFYQLIEKQFSVAGRISISGHSMGGHGALVMGLREPHKFRSVSAFSPIVNPLQCPWGQKAFAGYLKDISRGREYDACELLLSGQTYPHSIRVEQGSEDPFLKEQLLTPHLIQASESKGQKLDVRMREGYDHSYYFIATFIGEHVEFHAKALSV